MIENFAGINILGFIKCVSRFTRMIAGTICIIPKFAHKLLRHWYPGNILRFVLNVTVTFVTFRLQILKSYLDNKIDHFEIVNCEEHFGQVKKKISLQKKPFPQYERLI